MSETDAFPAAHPPEVPKPKREMSEKQRAAAKENLAKGAAAHKAKAKDRTVSVLRADARKTLIRWRSEAGTAGLLVAPVTATYIARTPDEVIDAALDLAGENAKYLSLIAAGGNLLAALVLLRWAGGLGVSVGVELGRIPADGPLADSFGLAEIVTDLEAKGILGTTPIEEPDVNDADLPDESPAPAGLAILPI